MAKEIIPLSARIPRQPAPYLLEGQPLTPPNKSDILSVKLSNPHTLTGGPYAPSCLSSVSRTKPLTPTVT